MDKVTHPPLPEVKQESGDTEPYNETDEFVNELFQNFLQPQQRPASDGGYDSNLTNPSSLC